MFPSENIFDSRIIESLCVDGGSRSLFWVVHSLFIMIILRRNFHRQSIGDVDSIFGRPLWDRSV